MPDLRKGTIMKPRAVVITVLVILVLIVIFQNREIVEFHFLFWNLPMSRIIWLLIVLLAGFAAGYLAGSRRGGKAGTRRP